MKKEILLEHLKEILQFSAIINSSLEIEQIRQKAAIAITKLVNCEAASLLLFDENTKELYFDVALGEKASQIMSIRLKLGQGIAGWVALQKQAVIINDVQNDPRFFKESDEKSGFKTKTMICLPLIIKDKERLIGVIQAINKKDSVFDAYDLELLEALANQVAIAIDNAKLYEELKTTFYEIVFALADTIEKKDPYTGGHTKRVMEYSVAIGIELGLSKKELENLKLAAILHDIGKIGISDSILLKKGNLSDNEFKVIQNHPMLGAEILSHIKQLKDIIPGVKHHHEKFDGSGYPEGLKGEEIPLIARIIAVADTFDAMTTNRPYRKGLSPKEALNELENKAGTQFDERIVSAFKKVLSRGNFENKSSWGIWL